MDPISDGCRLCLDPFADSFTTIDKPELKLQMAKVFCFSIEPKQGCSSGVCQSCSYVIFEFYQYSEKVRRNQEVLNVKVTNCDPARIYLKNTLDNVKIETLSNSGLSETKEDADEPEDEVSIEQEVSTLEPKDELKSFKIETLKYSGLETKEPGEVSGEEVPSLDSEITPENVKIERLYDSGLPEPTEDADEPKDEVLGEEVPTLYSEITFENFKIETLSDSEFPETTEDACESIDEGSIKEEAQNSCDDKSYEPLSKKSQTNRKGRPGKRKLDDVEADSKKTTVKTQQERNEEDQLFNKHFRMICDLCGTSTVNFTALRSHFYKEHKRNGYVVCCNKKLFKRNTIRDHIDFHANPDLFRCQMCGIKYKSKAILNEHILCMHSSDDQGPLKCDHCPLSFTQKNALAKHMERHVKVKCPKCNKMFASKCSLSYHMTTQHSGKDRTMVCDTCGQTFMTKQYFDRHIKAHMRIEDQRFQCEICQRWLKGEKSLRHHMNTLHTDGAREFQCDICPQKFKHSHLLRMHQIWKHASGSKHVCDFCGKKFKKAILLKEHRTIHTGEVLYTCEHCGISNNNKANLNKHIKRKHPTEWAQKKLMITKSSEPS